MTAMGKTSAWLRGGGWLLLLIAIGQFALHLWTNAHDQLFRDELYYLAAAQHLSAGYVEYPPFVAFAALVGRALFGATALGIRVLPAIAGATIVLLAASIAAMLGGGVLTQVLTGIAIALFPVFLAGSGLLTMDVFDQLWWVLCGWILVKMIKEERPGLWLAFGVVAGIGLLTKLTILFFVLALLIGLLLSEKRRLLWDRRLIYGGLLALLIASPYLVWQAQHGFPVVEYTGIYSSGKTYQATPAEFLIQQVLTTDPLAAPLWLGGLFVLFFTAAGRPYRAFGWAYLLLYVFFMLQKAKFYWLSPAYPVLFAAGAYGLQLIVERWRSLTWLRPAYTVALLLLGLFIVPTAIPILPPGLFLRQNALLGGAGDVKQENLVSSELPQNYADRYGWREMVTAAKGAYDTLTPAEQAEACFLTKNYGEAGAIDLYGAELGLPRAISGHNSYFLWGPQGCSSQVIITIGYRRAELAGSFESVEAGPSWRCDYCMPYENGANILIARGLKVPMQDAWPTVKDYN
jgi:hypothetical protein